MGVINRIRIKGFKSIRDMGDGLDLRDINVLIGANGSGKTNFISLFELIPVVVADDARQTNDFVEKMGGVRLLHGGPKVTHEIEVDIDSYGFSLFATDDSRLVLGGQHTAGVTQHPPDYVASLPFDQLVKRDTPGISTQMAYHFHDTGPFAAVRLPNDVDNGHVLMKDGRNLAPFLHRLRSEHPGHYENLRSTIQLVAPFFDDFSLVPEAGGHEIRLAWKERGLADTFGAHRLSDGTLRFICLTTLLLQPSPPPVVVIDEPELGLHPQAIGLFAEMAKRLSKTSQIVLATHSIDLINEFSPEDIIVVDREDGQSVFRRLKSEQLDTWLDDYSLGEVWMKNIIGGSPTA